MSWCKPKVVYHRLLAPFLNLSWRNRQITSAWECAPVVWTRIHPWILRGWAILLSRMGYCSNLNWNHHFRCADINIIFMWVQFHDWSSPMRWCSQAPLLIRGFPGATTTTVLVIALWRIHFGSWIAKGTPFDTDNWHWYSLPGFCWLQFVLVQKLELKAKGSKVAKRCHYSWPHAQNILELLQIGQWGARGNNCLVRILNNTYRHWQWRFNCLGTVLLELPGW